MLNLSWKTTFGFSSSEAEFYALSKAVKEIKFLIQVMQSLNIKIDLPIIVRVDDVRTIFMAENTSATGRTRHVEAHYHFAADFF